MTIENRNLEVGTRLVANYKKQAHVCAVEKTVEGRQAGLRPPGWQEVQEPIVRRLRRHGRTASRRPPSRSSSSRVFGYSKRGSGKPQIFYGKLSGLTSTKISQSDKSSKLIQRYRPSSKW